MRAPAFLLRRRAVRLSPAKLARRGPHTAGFFIFSYSIYSQLRFDFSECFKRF